MKKILLVLTLLSSASAFATDPEWSPSGGNSSKSGHSQKKAPAKNTEAHVSYEHDAIASHEGAIQGRIKRELQDSLKKMNSDNIADIKARNREVPPLLKCLDKNMDLIVQFGARGNDVIGPSDTGLTPAELRRVITEISNGARATTNWDE